MPTCLLVDLASRIFFRNTGTTVSEGVEVAGPVGFDLTGFSLVFYSGQSGAPYEVAPLGGIISSDSSDASNTHGTIWVGLANGLANGDNGPDAVALVRDTPPPATVIEFLSYGGTPTGDAFVAQSGPAAGLTSTSVGVHVTGSTPSGGGHNPGGQC